MNLLLAGNLVCLAGSVLMVAIGLIKEKKKILEAQCLQFGIFTVGNLMLGGVSGAISDGISIFRNLVCLRREYTPALKLLFIALQLGLTAVFNNLGLIGWLPVIAACIYTWCMDRVSEVPLKALIIATQLMWATYDLNIQNYTTLAFDLMTVLSNLIGILVLLFYPNKKTGS